MIIDGHVAVVVADYKVNSLLQEAQ